MSFQAFVPQPDGSIKVNLSHRARTLLQNLPQELAKQIESGDDDGSIYRLFPPGYTNDLERQVEFDRELRDDLQSHHLQSLRMLQDTADHDLLNPNQLHAWMKAINQLRLVLGTRLDVSEDFDLEESLLADDDPKTQALTLYVYLGELQHQAISALDPDLDPPE